MAILSTNSGTVTKSIVYELYLMLPSEFALKISQHTLYIQFLSKINSLVIIFNCKGDKSRNDLKNTDEIL